MFMWSFWALLRTGPRRNCPPQTRALVVIGRIWAEGLDVEGSQQGQKSKARRAGFDTQGARIWLN